MIERMRDCTTPYHLDEVYYIQMWRMVDGSSCGYTAFKNGWSLGYGFTLHTKY
jgi:hypothetical protein